MKKRFLAAPASAVVLVSTVTAVDAATVVYELMLTPTHAALHNVQIIETDTTPDAVRTYCMGEDNYWDCHNETIALNIPDSVFGFVETPVLTGRLEVTDGTHFSCDIAMLSICADGFDIAQVYDPDQYYIDVSGSDFRLSFHDGYDTAEWLFSDRAAWWSGAYIDTTWMDRPLVGWPGDWEAFGLDIRGQIDIGFEYDVAVMSSTTMASTPLPASLPLILAGLGGLGLMRCRRTRAT